MTGDQKLAAFLLTVILVIILVSSFIRYLFLLQRRFLEACHEQKQLALFAQAPAGLPVGTIRAVLALSIVLTGLFVILASFLLGGSIPQALTAIMGSVLGFYFGARTAERPGDEQAVHHTKELETQRDEAVKAKDASDAGGLLKKIEQGIALTKTVTAALPPDAQQKYDDVVRRTEDGLKAAQALADGGNPVAATSKAADVLRDLETASPVRDVVATATASFVAVLGNAVPQIAVINAVVAVSSALIGVAYQKWKARILHLPFSPAVIPLQVVDANTGFSLFLQCPIFKQAFAAELEANDRPFMTAAVQDFLREDDLETLWQKYQKHFESREQFQEGVDEFQRAAADIELKSTIDPALVSPPGGYESLVSAVDKLHADPDARGHLDELMEIVEGLKESGASPKVVFDEALQEKPA